MASRAAGGNLFYYDEKLGRSSSLKMIIQDPASACFILSIEDKLLGPHSTPRSMSRRPSCSRAVPDRHHFSKIRAEGESLTGGGHSSAS